eukprot:scaffold73021_cov61-Phaeocystis_antarctica.AAC.8
MHDRAVALAELDRRDERAAGGALRANQVRRSSSAPIGERAARRRGRWQRPARKQAQSGARRGQDHHGDKWVVNNQP